MKIESVAHFQEITGKKAIILFSADYCGDCQMFKPFFEKIGQDYPDAPIYLCDTQQFLDLAQKENITSIPTVRFYQNGENRLTLGEYNEKGFRNFVEKTLF